MSGCIGILGNLLDDRCDLNLYCPDCLHSGPTLRIELLVEAYGYHLPVERFRRRARCSRCGHRGNADLKVSPIAAQPQFVPGHDGIGFTNQHR